MAASQTKVYSKQEMLDIRDQYRAAHPSLQMPKPLMLFINESKTCTGGRKRGALEAESKREDVFVSTAVKKNIDVFDENSDEAKMSEANVILNRLREINIRMEIGCFNKIGLPIETKTRLLIDRAQIDSEKPEADPQAKTFGKFLAELFNARNEELKSSFLKELEAQYIARTKSDKSSPLKLQNMTVCFAYLFIKNIITRQQYFQSLYEAQTNLNSNLAFQVIYSTLSVSGEYIDANHLPEVARFYRFLRDKQNEVNNGYLKFLVADLFELRSAKWDRKNIPKVVSKAAPKEAIKPQKKFSEADNYIERIEALLTDFLSGNQIPALPQNLNAEAFTADCYRNCKKHIRDNEASQYGEFIAEIIQRFRLKQDNLLRLLSNCNSIIADEAVQEDTGSVWDPALSSYLFLAKSSQINFEDIGELLSKVPKDCPQPDFKYLTENMKNLEMLLPMEAAEKFAQNIGEMSNENSYCLMMAISDEVPSNRESLKNIWGKAKSSKLLTGFVAASLGQLALSEEDYMQVLKEFSGEIKSLPGAFRPFFDFSLVRFLPPELSKETKSFLAS